MMALVVLLHRVPMEGAKHLGPMELTGGTPFRTRSSAWTWLAVT